MILSTGVRDGTFTVYNIGTTDVDVTLSTYDFVVDPNGERAPVASPLPGGAAAWLVPSPASFHLGIDGVQEVHVTVTQPIDAAPGDHYAGVAVIGDASDGTAADPGQAQPSPTPKPTSGATIHSRVRFGVTVVTRVPGVVHPDLQIPGFEVFLPGLVVSSSGQFTFSPQIVNTGNVAAAWVPKSGPNQTLEKLTPTLHLKSTVGLFGGDAVLFEGSRTDTGSVKLSPLVVLPGTSHTQELTLNDVPLFDTYDYTYRIPGSVADGRADIIKTGSFTIINLQKVLYWIVLPLIVLLVLISITLIGRRRRTLQRRTAEALRMRDLQKARLEGYEQAWHDQMAAQGRRPRG